MQKIEVREQSQMTDKEIKNARKRIAYICCTLPTRDTFSLELSAIDYCLGKLFIYKDKKIPARLPTTERYQRAYELTKNKRFDYYMFIGDDCLFKPDFEKNMILGINELFKLTGDRRVFVYPNDGMFTDGNLATHPMFTKEWIEALGYFFPVGYMNHCFIDNWITDLGMLARRCMYIPIARLQHNHFSITNSVKDKYIESAYKDSAITYDCNEHKRLIKERMASDLLKLGIKDDKTEYIDKFYNRKLI